MAVFPPPPPSPQMGMGPNPPPSKSVYFCSVLALLRTRIRLFNFLVEHFLSRFKCSAYTVRMYCIVLYGVQPSLLISSTLRLSINVLFFSARAMPLLLCTCYYSLFYHRSVLLGIILSSWRDGGLIVRRFNWVNPYLDPHVKVHLVLIGCYLLSNLLIALHMLSHH